MIVYDIRWYLLPNRLVYPFLGLAFIQVFLKGAVFDGGIGVFQEAFWGLVIGGGIFYLLFQVSGGKWIGGGDVKLGALLGLLVGGPAASFLLLFIASLLGSMVSLPLLASGRLNRKSHLPFGPFLIVTGIIVYLFSNTIIEWYKQKLLLY